MNLELLAFSSSWSQAGRSTIGVSLSFMGVPCAASIQTRATTKAAAELSSVRLAFHTRSLLQDFQLQQPLCFRVLTRGPLAQKLGLSKKSRHIELWSRLGQFQLSKVQPRQNLAEQLANTHTACGLHRLLPKLKMHTRPAEMVALPTVQAGEPAFVPCSSSFYIGTERTKIAHRCSLAIFIADEVIAGNSAARIIFTSLHRRKNRGSLAIFFAEEIAHLGASKSRAIFPRAVKIAAATAENRAILVHSA